MEDCETWLADCAEITCTKENRDVLVLSSPERTCDPLPLPPPPPNRRDVCRVIQELLEHGEWIEVFDAASQCPFYYCAASGLSTWSLEFIGERILLAQLCGQHPDTAQPNSPSWREKILSLYQNYNPSKIGIVDDLLQKYRGNEGELWRNLKSKYASPSNASPKISPLSTQAKTRSTHSSEGMRHQSPTMPLAKTPKPATLTSQATPSSNASQKNAQVKTPRSTHSSEGMRHQSPTMPLAKTPRPATLTSQATPSSNASQKNVDRSTQVKTPRSTHSSEGMRHQSPTMPLAKASSAAILVNSLTTHLSASERAEKKALRILTSTKFSPPNCSTPRGTSWQQELDRREKENLSRRQLFAQQREEAKSRRRKIEACHSSESRSTSVPPRPHFDASSPLAASGWKVSRLIAPRLK